MLLFNQRDKIKRVMRLKKALDHKQTLEDERMTDRDKAQHRRILESLSSRDEKDITLEDIAHADTAHRHRRPSWRKGLGLARPSLIPMRQMPSSYDIANSEKREVSPLLLSLQGFYEKYEADTYWCVLVALR